MTKMSSRTARGKATAKPVVKWTGGKTQLLPELEKYLPLGFGGYHEPFVGGGAFFFHLWNLGLLDDKPVHLYDTNLALISAYRDIRDSLPNMIKNLTKLAKLHRVDDRKRYEAIRRAFNAASEGVYRSSLFIYLNRVCFNGLYRVNKAGAFNVPMGHYKNPTILDEARLEAVSEALQGVSLHCCTFARVLDKAEAGDLVYFDPPYLPVKADSFTSYTSDGFGSEDHELLASTAALLFQKGCEVIVSNSDSARTHELYRARFIDIHRVRARRSINSKGNGRGEVSECVITFEGDRPRGVANGF